MVLCYYSKKPLKEGHLGVIFLLMATAGVTGSLPRLLRVWSGGAQVRPGGCEVCGFSGGGVWGGSEWSGCSRGGGCPESRLIVGIIVC